MPLGNLASALVELRARVQAADLRSSSSRELIDLIAGLEDLKTTAEAVQAQASVAFDSARRSEQATAGVPARRQGRGVAAEVALARRESPHRGQVLLGLAKILVGEMPHTLDRMRNGSLSEFRATLLARETACLEAEQRAFVDQELCADPAALEGVGTRELVGRVKRMVAELDPAAVVRRARKAETERCVSIRPAPDAMTYLTALLPVADGVAAYAALTKDAERMRAGGDPRAKGQLMADLMLTRLTGLPDTGSPDQAPAVPVTVNVVLPDTALAGGHTPAEVNGEVVPAEIARLLAARAMDAGLATWFRSLYRNPLGRLVAMSSRQRCFPEGLAEFLSVQGGGICATPFCDAPIRHTDHIQPVDEGGTTSAVNGQGLCEACNHAKQAHGWQQQRVEHPQERPETQTITPTGHRYTARAPAPPGYREPHWQQAGPGRYELIS